MTKLSSRDDEILPQEDEGKKRMIRRHGERKGWSWNTQNVCKTVLCLSLLCNVVVVGFLFSESLESSDPSASGPEADTPLGDSICVICDIHQSVPTWVKMTEIVIDERSVLCCFNNFGAFQKLAEILYYKDRGKDVDESRLPGVTPAAHIYLDKVTETGLMKTIRVSIPAHVSGGVIYSNGSLRVPEDGIYFLYSHVTFNRGETKGKRYMTIVHMVKRSNDLLPLSGNQILLVNNQWLSENEVKSSFLSAAVRLRRNDEVFVQVSEPSLVQKYPGRSYFGLCQLKV